MHDSLKKYKSLVGQINEAFSHLQALSDDELRLEVRHIEDFIHHERDAKSALDKSLVQVFAIVKETARRFSVGGMTVSANESDIELSKSCDFITIEGEKAIYRNRWDAGGVPFEWRMVHYDEQLLGGILLHYGYAIEMATGEGKTLVATLPAFLNSLTHEGVHLMTANDYLSRRDFELTRPIYLFHGLTASCIDYYYRNGIGRKNAYKADITFGKTSSFVFDYLEDHLVNSAGEIVQVGHNYAIIDEIDSTLIDEAVTPHIVSGGAKFNSSEIYKQYDEIITELLSHKSWYRYDVLRKYSAFTSRGKKWLEKKTGIEGLFSYAKTYQIPDFNEMDEQVRGKFVKVLYSQNVLHNLLAAYTVFEKDIDYVVDGGKVKIVDYQTGRIREGSRWEHGIHTAIEVKEKVDIQDESNGIAVISLGNYFRLYDKVSGMSGTIMDEKKAFSKTYNLKCAVIPSHRQSIRTDIPLKVFRTLKEKNDAIIEQIRKNQSAGCPTLVSCTSVKVAREISELLEKNSIRNNLLDALSVKNESILVSQAGIGNTVTVSTSIAGRGTDIKPSEDALANGGLYVIGTELFDSARVDKQLKGRTGRQGNPGTTSFFASLDDPILRFLGNNEKEQLLQLTRNTDNDCPPSSYLRTFFLKAQENRESLSRKQRIATSMKDDIVDPYRRRYYKTREGLISDTFRTDIYEEYIDAGKESSTQAAANIQALYRDTSELLRRLRKNNLISRKADIPLTNRLQPFVIRLDIDSVIGNDGLKYFCDEFKRQTTLQVLDSFWTRFVLYVLGDLDKREVAQIDYFYNSLKEEAKHELLERVMHSSIPFDNRQKMEDDSADVSYKRERARINNKIAPDSLCPCGSGKKYCECHGSAGIRSKYRSGRRH